MRITTLLDASNNPTIQPLLARIGSSIINEHGHSENVTHADLDDAWDVALIPDPEHVTPLVSQMRRKLMTFGLVILTATPALDATNGKMKAWLHTLVRQGVITPYQIILVGLRDWTIEEYRLITEWRIRHFTMRQIMRDGLSDAIESVMMNARSYPQFLLVIDVSVLDPSVTQSMTTPIPGGLSAREVIDSVQRLRLLKSMHAAVITGIKPQPMNSQDAELYAKLAIEAGTHNTPETPEEPNATWE